MTTLEDDIRAVLVAQAEALRVPPRPTLDPNVGEGDGPRGARWLAAAACLALVAAGIVALAAWPSGDPEPAPVASIVPDTTTPAPTVTSVVPDKAVPAPATNGWVAIESGQFANSEIYLVRPGQDARRLAVAGSDTATEACPAWSPDGTQLMFGRVTDASDTAPSDDQLVIVPVGSDGAAGTPTTIALDGFDVLDGFDIHPCAIWAPDGRWVALAAADEVWVVDTQTGEIRRLPGLRPSDLEWRPGTDQLAIAGDMGMNRDAPTSSTPVTLYSVSTGELGRLGSIEAAHLTWSPDGSTLAFTGGEDGPDELRLVDADGANERSLVADLGEANHGIGPVWSPAGDRIAYQRICCGGAETHEVVLLNVTDGSETVIEPAGWYPYSVTWSPDGTTLLYAAWSVGDGDGGLITVPVDTPTDVTVLGEVTETGSVYSHRWNPVQRWGRQPVVVGSSIDDENPPPTTAPSGLDGAAASVDPAVADVLDGFLAARVAGDGAEQYLDAAEGDIPLLYATTSGARYERAEFEPVPGIEWPYGWSAFKVRLFAEDTVVEQLVFTDAAVPLEIKYQRNGFGTNIAPTTEDGRPVGVPLKVIDGTVTLQVGHPWIMQGGVRFGYGRLIPQGLDVRPTTDGGERNGWDEIYLIADPSPVTDCPPGPSAVDAESLAESIRSDPALGATAPRAVRIGGVDALMMDVENRGRRSHLRNHARWGGPRRDRAPVPSPRPLRRIWTVRHRKRRDGPRNG